MKRLNIHSGQNSVFLKHSGRYGCATVVEGTVSINELKKKRLLAEPCRPHFQIEL
jgi:hypothetical protein